jgi:hypothetical protein
MTMIDINFQWTRSRAYECVTEAGRKRIVPVGKRDSFEPLKIESEKPLYMRFAELDGSADACLNFARTWGLLKTQTEPERLDDWKREIDGMKWSISALRDFEENPIGPSQTIRVTTLDICLVTAGTNSRRPSLLSVPSNLISAMYLQLGKFVASAGSIGACKQCGEWFERGASESRRSISIFCSEKCKNRFHYLERAKR